MGLPKKQKTQSDKDLCRMVTPEFRVSYPHLFKPQSMNKEPGAKLKFSVVMLFPKELKSIVGASPSGEKRTMSEIIRNAKVAEYGPKENWPDDLEVPYNDGDDDKFADKQGYIGHWAFRASTNEDQRPTIVDRDMSPITEAALIYPGCYARAYIYAYVWHFGKKSGVGLILDHVQKLRDGKSFGGKKPVEQVFSPLPTLEEDEVGESDEEADFSS